MAALFDYIAAMTHLYGRVHRDQVLQTYEKFEGKQLPADVYDTLIRSSEEDLQKLFVYVEDDYFLHETVCEFDELYEAVESARRRPFYQPDKDELLRYKDPDYFEKNRYFEALVDFIRQHNPEDSAYTAEEMAEEMHYEVEMDQPLADLSDGLKTRGIILPDKESEEEAARILQKLDRHTRRFQFNGYTAAELLRLLGLDEDVDLQKMRQEIEEAVAQRKSDVTDYIRALTNIYGLVSAEMTAKVYEEYEGTALPEGGMKSILQMPPTALWKDFIRVQDGYFAAEPIYDAEDLKEALADRAGKPYYIPPKEELLRYKDHEYEEDIPQLGALEMFLERFPIRIKENSARDLAVNAQDLFYMTYDIDEIMKDLKRMGLELKTTEDKREAARLIRDIGLHTRIWGNNGHTIQELIDLGVTLNKDEMPQLPKNLFPEEEKKTGRNDPCPCGSGKKYKNCCMRKEAG